MPKLREEIDWNELKKEYIQGGTSYRKLAKKYDVSFQILQNVAKQEKWTELRGRAKDETNTKIVTAIAKENAKHLLKINKVADKLLDKIEATLDSIDALDSQSIKHFTSALKDIKDIKGIKSEGDLAEQEARINKLRKDCEDEQKDNDINVTLEGGIEEWSK